MKRQRFLTVPVGAMVLGGVLMAGDGTGVTPAWADTPLVLPSVTQNWDKNLPSTSRFTVLAKFNNQAVRDNNTGLVWEQAPNGTPRSWNDAVRYCLNKVVPTVGGTGGWRLPSTVELKSVQDGSSTAPFVPASAFTLSTSYSTPGVQSVFYWSATKCH